jgi:hypothetical protein
MRRSKQIVLIVGVLGLAVVMAVCGSNPSSTRSTPPTISSPTPAGIYKVTGLVADLPGSHPVPSATIAITSGANTNRSAVSDADGRYSIADLAAGPATLHASAAGYAAQDDSIVLHSNSEVNFRLPQLAPPPSASAPQCDPSLWPHMHDVQRIKIVKPCQTVSGVIATVGTSDDGDIDMQLTLDAGFGNLLNSANISKLNGNLQIEAICQARVHDDVPDALRTCANFTGTVPIPALGTHVQVTGVYVLDSDHGWMEIHPISALTRAP